MMVPNSDDLSAAWAGLPAATRNHIGFVALNMVFQGFLSGSAYGLEDYVLASDDDRGEAYDQECRGLTELYRTIEDALPDLFGPAGESPAWSQTAGGARA